MEPICREILRNACACRYMYLTLLKVCVYLLIGQFIIDSTVYAHIILALGPLYNITSWVDRVHYMFGYRVS